MRVFVYYNLHRHLWSIKALEGPNKGRVIGHSEQVCLLDCEFKVSEAGRQRVLRERRKNVHAGVVGRLADAPCPQSGDTTGVTYNPYRYATFVEVGSETPIAAAPRAWLDTRKVFVDKLH